MYALKALVLFMGLLIVMGLTLIGWGIYKKADDPDFKFFDLSGGDKPTAVAEAPGTPTLPAATAAPTAPAKTFPTIALNIPEGCVVDEMRPSGKLLYLRLGPTLGDCEQILVIDIASGQKLGTVDLRP